MSICVKEVDIPRLDVRLGSWRLECASWRCVYVRVAAVGHGLRSVDFSILATACISIINQNWVGKSSNKRRHEEKQRQRSRAEPCRSEVLKIGDPRGFNVQKF